MIRSRKLDSVDTALIIAGATEFPSVYQGVSVFGSVVASFFFFFTYLETTRFCMARSAAWNISAPGGSGAIGSKALPTSKKVKVLTNDGSGLVSTLWRIGGPRLVKKLVMNVVIRTRC